MEGSTQTEPQTAVSGPQGAKQTQDDPGVEYVVQRRTASPSAVTGDEVWTDIATPAVPKRTFTRTIILQAVKEAGIKPELTDRFRVLDADAAREYQLKPKAQAEPEYEVSEVVDGESREVAD